MADCSGMSTVPQPRRPSRTPSDQAGTDLPRASGDQGDQWVQLVVEDADGACLDVRTVIEGVATGHIATAGLTLRFVPALRPDTLSSDCLAIQSTASLNAQSGVTQEVEQDSHAHDDRF